MYDGYNHYIWKPKGGVGKSTTVAFLLYEKRYHVLSIDMDSQANMVQMIANTDDFLQYEKQTIKEGMEGGDVHPYVLAVTDYLHFIPADDYLVLINENRDIRLLKQALKSVQDYYDFIIIDIPPTLSKQSKCAYGKRLYRRDVPDRKTTL